MKKTILVVEDNPKNMRLMRMILSANGYDVLEATDGEEGLKMAQEGRPDLIVLDIQLPKMEGTEVAKRLRAMPEFDGIPLIALTAYAMKGDQERILEAGFDSYMSKPIDTRELPSLVAQMLSR
ncbi:MAG: response regulator [Chloroflexota bacterium]|nr:response regulator [Chloroflexota bacterium]